MIDGNLLYDLARNYHSEPFLMGLELFVFCAPFLLLLLVGILVEARTPSGKKLGRPMILSPNFVFVILVFLFQFLLVALKFFPFWLRWFK